MIHQLKEGGAVEGRGVGDSKYRENKNFLQLDVEHWKRPDGSAVETHTRISEDHFSKSKKIKNLKSQKC